MGTLFDQSPRRRRSFGFEQLDSFVEKLLKIAEKHEVPIDTVIQAKIALERERFNDLYLDNGDIFDEQIGGMGELLRDSQKEWRVEMEKSRDEIKEPD